MAETKIDAHLILPGGSPGDLLSNDGLTCIWTSPPSVPTSPYALGGGTLSIVGSGVSNLADGAYSVNGGGNGNTISSGSTAATVSGGNNNTILLTSGYSTISGGVSNNISDSLQSTVGGGVGNSVSAAQGTISGGSGNSISFVGGAIGGGEGNSIIGDYGAIPGGQNNTAASYSFAAGKNAHADNAGTFVWADSTGAAFTSTLDNSFVVRALNGVGINTASPDESLHVVGSIKMVDGNESLGRVLTSDANGVGSWAAVSVVTPAGTAGAIQFNSSPAGSFAADSGQLWWSETNNRLAIGHASPGHMLDIINGDSTAFTASFQAVGTAGVSQGIKIQAGTNSSDTSFIVKDTTNTTTYLKVRGDGNVGIGTASPASALEVNGQVKITGGTPGAGKVLTDVSGSGLATWENASAPSQSLSWVKYTFTATVFSTAATTNSIAFPALANGTVIHAVKIKSFIGFSGTGITSYTLSVGISGNEAKYASAYEVETTANPVSAGTFQISNVLGSEDWTLPTTLYATATSVGANLNAAALAGQADIWVLQSVAV